MTLQKNSLESLLRRVTLLLYNDADNLYIHSSADNRTMPLIAAY